MDSILTSVKQQLGITEDYTAFDTELIIHINTVLRIVNQLGVGKLGYVISSEDPGSWATFLGPRENELSEVKTYIYAKVRLIFDPPSVGSHITALENIVKELEWRINVQIDPFDYDWTNET
jgi:hypothetical protein